MNNYQQAIFDFLHRVIHDEETVGMLRGLKSGTFSEVESLLTDCVTGKPIATVTMKVHVHEEETPQ